ncbi:MAG: hypothetical protein MZV70_19070 [Desulfobacterales bacterium]|nr:hypothetical protein [Desulfobacterales bacterium]
MIRLPLIAGCNDRRATPRSRRRLYPVAAGGAPHRPPALPPVGEPKYHRLNGVPLGRLPALPAERVAQVRRVLKGGA